MLSIIFPNGVIILAVSTKVIFRNQFRAKEFDDCTLFKFSKARKIRLGE